MPDYSRVPSTLMQFLMHNQPKGSRGAFTLLMMAIQTSVKVIEMNIRSAGAQGLFGHLNDGRANATGDAQAKLDVVANNAFKAYLMSSASVSFMGSEEDESIVVVSSGQQGDYVVFFDPLDGSSNIDANISIGSVWGIWCLPKGTKVRTTKDALKVLPRLSGRYLVSSGYAMYGTATNLVITTGSCVNGFTLDTTVGEFIHTHPNITLPQSRPIYSVNEGNLRHWDAWFKQYLHHIKNEGEKAYTARYIGSMVADIHRTLLYGGIFCYPGDKKKPGGKLRLMYEAAPMAFLIEQAGGLALTGDGRLLDVVPKEIHQRAPVFMGSRREVELCMSFKQKYNDRGGVQRERSKL
ncbi:fructose-1 [Trypanosoma brucei equiperdum]|uniref:fructose-bisphosphatase n=1 Tax=Trypanosoma brucei equiperdum TaxID=630700 RepID=A0A3L6L5E9_9TRYP|nr:fructose-1 [Trypanosoma brucei equiperdum]